MRIVRLALVFGITCLSMVCGADKPIGHIDWSHHGGGNGWDAIQAIHGLPDGSFYTQGWFTNTFDASLSQNPRAFGYRDVFLAKYDREGNLLWVRSDGSNDCDLGGAIDALPDGTIACTGAYGYSSNTAIFGHGQPTQTTLTGIGDFAFFLCKYDGNGNLLWAKSAGGPDPDFGNSLALAPNGSVFVGGGFLGNAIFFNRGLPSQVVIPETSTGEGGRFLAHYDTNGVFQWAKPVYCSNLIALADNTGLAATPVGLIGYAEDGTELWRAESLASNYVDMAPLGGTDFAIAYVLGQGTRVSRYRVEADHSLTLAWSQDLSVAYPNTRMSARPDGSLVVASGATLWTISPDGSSLSQGTLSFSPIGLYAVPEQNYCLMIQNLYSQVTLGDQTYFNLGGGDFFIAKASTLERYQVTPAYEGVGSINFHGPSNWYWKGEQATLTAVSVFPNAYEFIGWGGDFEGETDETITFTVDGDKQALARFELLEGASLPAASAWALVALAIALAAASVRGSLLNPPR